MSGQCLTEDDYAGVLGDSLSGDERVRVAIHVSECEECRTTLEERRLLGLTVRGPGRSPGSTSPRPGPGPGPGAGVPGPRSRWRVGIPWALVVVLLVLSIYVSLQLTAVIERQRNQLESAGGGALGGSRSEWEAQVHRDRMRFAARALEEDAPDLLQDILSGTPDTARGWAWQRLHALADRSRSRHSAGAGGAAAFLVAPNGRSIIGGRDGLVRMPVRDRRDTALEWPAHEGPVLALALSPDGKTIASGGEDQKIHLWRRADGELLRTLEGHSWSVLALGFARDGTVLVSAGRDETVRQWRVADGQPVATLEDHRGPVSAVAATDGGVVSGGEDGKLLWWPWDSSSSVELDVAGGEIFSLRVVHGLLVCGRATGVLQVWSIAERRVLRVLRGHRRDVVALAAAAGTLASADSGGTILTWDAETDDVAAWTRRGTLHGHRAAVRGLRFSSDGTMLRSAGDDDAVRVWDAALRDVRSQPLHCGAVEWCRPAGSALLFGCEHGVVQLIDMRTWQTIDAAPMVRDGRLLDLDAGGARVLIRAEDDSLRVRELSGGELLRVEGIAAAALAPSGEEFAVWRDGALVLVTVADGSERILTEDLSDVRELVYGPGGAWLGCRPGDASLMLWPTTEGGEPLVFDLVGGAPLQLRFAPAGDRVATVGATGGIDVFDLADGETVTFAGPPLEGPADGPRQLCLAFAPGGGRLVTGDDAGKLHVWDAEHGHELLEWQAHDGPIRHVRFVGEGPLISVGADGTLRRWRGRKST